MEHEKFIKKNRYMKIENVFIEAWKLSSSTAAMKKREKNEEKNINNLNIL